MTMFMDNQPVKNRKDLKPFVISNTAQETNEQSTSELGVYIVLGVFICMIYGIDGYMDVVMTFISSYIYDFK